jgi:hypothetical protein
MSPLEFADTVHAKSVVARMKASGRLKGRAGVVSTQGLQQWLPSRRAAVSASARTKSRRCVIWIRDSSLHPRHQ